MCQAGAVCRKGVCCLNKPKPGKIMYMIQLFGLCSPYQINDILQHALKMNFQLVLAQKGNVQKVPIAANKYAACTHQNVNATSLFFPPNIMELFDPKLFSLLYLFTTPTTGPTQFGC